ncbi:hypothetical protein EBS57_09035 [bacterium]|nr:hypothetical protein [bacterium]
MVGLHHLVQVHVAPALRRAVHQLKGRLLAEEFGDVPIGGLQGFGVAGLVPSPVSGPDHLLPNPQLEFSLLSPADQKTQIGTFDFEGQGGQGAGRRVAPVFGSDKTLPLKSLHRSLAGDRARHWPGAEGFARRGPVPELVAFKIGHH